MSSLKGITNNIVILFGGMSVLYCFLQNKDFVSYYYGRWAQYESMWEEQARYGFISPSLINSIRQHLRSMKSSLESFNSQAY